MIFVRRCVLRGFVLFIQKVVLSLVFIFIVELVLVCSCTFFFFPPFFPPPKRKSIEEKNCVKMCLQVYDSFDACSSTRIHVPHSCNELLVMWVFRKEGRVVNKFVGCGLSGLCIEQRRAVWQDQWYMDVPSVLWIRKSEYPACSLQVSCHQQKRPVIIFL